MKNDRKRKIEQIYHICETNKQLPPKDVKEVIMSLEDENSALWEMLDEMKASDILNYQSSLKTAIEDTIKSIHKLSKSTTGEA